MKSKYLLLSLLSIFLMSSCSFDITNPQNSESDQESHESNNESSENKDSSESSEESSSPSEDSSENKESSESNEESSESIEDSNEESSSEEEIVVTSLGELKQNSFEMLKYLDSPYELEILVNYSDGSYEYVPVSNDMFYKGYVDFYNVGTYKVSIQYLSFIKDYEINVYKKENLHNMEFTNHTSIKGIESYPTGSYCYYSEAGIDFEFYKAHRGNKQDLVSLLPKKTNYEMTSKSGAIYNTSPMYGINQMTITYKTYGDGLIVSKGKVRSEMEDVNLDESNGNFTSFTLNFNNDNYFKIETKSTKTDIKSIEFDYSDKYQSLDEDYFSSGENLYRLNPSTFEGTLVSGQSSITLPIAMDVNKDGSYTVTDTKTYTYYSYDNVKNNPHLVNEAAMLSPMDVSNYYIAFGTHPANYVYKKSFSSASKTFKEKTRCISHYSRTDGYARAVPYASKYGEPSYYELDIALEDQYNSNRRGVGRVVLWEYGFVGNGYDSNSVAVFTDDHYATFMEYYNNGSWSNRFNAEKEATIYRHGEAKTLN